MKHLLSINDMTVDEINQVFEWSEKLKKYVYEGMEHHLLKGKTLGMIFSKSSTRTRVSFETGMYQLGGHPLFLSSNDIQIGRGESMYDTAKVLSRYIDGIMIRTFKQSDVEQLAQYGTIPVINGLTDDLHPCQILTDLFTVMECKGDLRQLKLAYVGDGNNIANSLLYGCSKTGMTLSIATPKGYECNQTVIKNATENAKKTGAVIEILNDPVKAVEKADVVYTDTWVSMGQEEEKADRINRFKEFQVNKELWTYADKDAIFLHCLPAYRGYEVTRDIIDGPMSKVFDQAENRLHVQKAVMVMLLKDRNK